jgi:activating signal cointegrator 1
MKHDLNDAGALTIWNPWAMLIAWGEKRFETRGHAINYRGTILIHAGATWNARLHELCFTEPFCSVIEHQGISMKYRPYTGSIRLGLPLGAIVAVADLVECWWMRDQAIPGFQIDARERAFGDFSPGRYAWQLENVIALAEPVKAAGRQGIWYPSVEVHDQVARQLMAPVKGGAPCPS